ncbi:MAG: uridine kinase [Myxococcales bacterium]|nr:uridine kinase [Myxococcales bacterium]
MMAVVVLGIAGGTGSGKTTVARAIVERIGPDRVAYLEHDSYYRDLSHLSLAQRREVNFDHPDAFDSTLLIRHVEALKRGQAVEQPVYSYTESVRRADTVRVDPRPLVIVEGILVLENTRLRDLMDVKIFVDTADDIRLMRRLRRDTHERGRTMEHVLGQYEATVRPMHLTFVMPSRRHADVVIPRGGSNRVAIEMVSDGLEKRLRTLDAPS